MQIKKYLVWNGKPTSYYWKLLKFEKLYDKYKQNIKIKKGDKYV